MIDKKMPDKGERLAMKTKRRFALKGNVCMKNVAHISLVFLSLSAGASAFASCPTDIQEVAAQARRMVVKTAASQSSVTGISDFSESATGATQGFIVGSETLYLVQAVGTNQSVNGVVQCDAKTQELVVLSISWQSPTSYGTMGGVYPQPR